MKKKIYNLTNHDINIVTKKGTVILKPVGVVPRLNQELSLTETIEIDGAEIEIKESYLTDICDLPEEKENVYYVVSLPTAQSLPDRKDLLFPNEVIRNEKGQTVACRSLCRVKI